METGENTDDKVVLSDSEEHEGMLIECMFRGICDIHIVRFLISRFLIIMLIFVAETKNKLETCQNKDDNKVVTSDSEEQEGKSLYVTIILLTSQFL